MVIEKMEKNVSASLLVNCINSGDVLRKSLEFVEHFPPVPYYGELLKLTGKQLLSNGDEEKAITHLADCQSVSLRHKTLNIYKDNKVKHKKSKSDSLRDTLDNFKHCTQIETSLDFKKPNFPMWLKNLPSKWTVVQIVEMRCGKQNMKLLGGPPVEPLPNLVVIRYPCGDHRDQPIITEIETPAKVENGGLLVELSSILEGNRRVNNDYRGNREQYWKVKQEHHNQLKVLVTSLENWWLGYYKCLLLGELKEPSEINILNKAAQSVISFAKKAKGAVTEKQEHWIHLLLSSCGYLSDVQMIKGFSAVFNLQPKNDFIVEIVKQVKKVEADLTKLKTAKRHPVILILDKVVQQLPWETMPVLEHTPLSRVPSLHILHSLVLKHGFRKGDETKQMSPMIELKVKTEGIFVNAKLGYYVLNPGQDLPGVEQRLKPLLEQIWGKQGVVGMVPVEQKIKESLVERDLFLYCGHGSGTKYLSNDHIVKLKCRAAPLLMGCSSGQLKAIGRQVDPTGAAAHYLMAGSPCLVGMLWEVTDIDCDRYTIRFLDLWLNARQRQDSKQIHSDPMSTKLSLPPPPEYTEPELLRAVADARHVTKNFLTGAAAVAYGLPAQAVGI